MVKELKKTLIEDFCRGDMEALQEIYAETKDFVYNVIYRMVYDKEETKDLMQDVYIKIFESRRNYNELSAAFTTWLYRIAFNHALNFVNRKKMITGKQLILESKSEKSELVTETIADQEDVASLQRLLLKVRPKYRICVVLCDIERLSYEETARRLGINIGTVRSRLNRGRKELNELYRKEGRLYELQRR
jgi:RNA polymerase sigma-70 factor (ECF subfamily)